MNTPGSEAASHSAGAFEKFTQSPHFAQWLAEQKLSLAVSTYQKGLLFLIGVDAEARLSVRRRSFDYCMGLAGNGQTIWMSTRYQLWRLENALEQDETIDGHDRLYVPRMSFTTGAVDGHDVGLDATGQPVFVATRFNCIAAPSETHSFRLLWKPPFVPGLIDGDCCHLNGLAMAEGVPRYATAVSTTGEPDGWRKRRADGGVVIDVATNDIVLHGLSMPHSPRLVDDVLYVANSGNGRFGRVDTRRGQFEEIAFCPGFIRGMAICPPFAVIGLSQVRQTTLTGLTLTEELERHNTTAFTGLVVVDLRSGGIVHWLRIDGATEELYDVLPLPGVVRPAALGLLSDQIQQMVKPLATGWSRGGR